MAGPSDTRRVGTKSERALQEAESGKTVMFASQPIIREGLKRWLESEIDRKLAATEASNTLAEVLTSMQRNMRLS